MPGDTSIENLPSSPVISPKTFSGFLIFFKVIVAYSRTSSVSESTTDPETLNRIF